MTISFYDLSVTSYLNVLGAVASVLAKGADALAQPDNMVDQRMMHDMLPFNFQVRSVVHHSLGSIQGIQSGEFRPPPAMPAMDYAGLQAHLQSAIDGLNAIPAEEIEALSGQNLVFKLSEAELPFSAVNFVESFSKPNLFFHATTTYTMLRQQGVELGKRDFLGNMRIG